MTRAGPSSRRIYMAWLAAGSAIGVFVAAVVVSGVGGDLVNDPLLALTIPLLAVVGAFVMVKQPDNAIGPVIALVGVAGAVSGLAAAVGGGDTTGAATLPGSGPLLRLVIAFGDATWWTFFGGTMGLFPLLFPTGRPPSRRWRPLVWALAVGLGVSALLSLLRPEVCQTLVTTGGSETVVCVDSPIGVPGLIPPEAVVALVVLPAALGGILSLFVRFRRAGHVERLQLKWLVFAMAVIVVNVLVAEILIAGFFGVRLPWFLEGRFDLVGASFLLVPISIGIAVLRYRLYEIDRVVSRTVTYGAVALMLGAAYVTLAVLPVLIVGSEMIPAWLVAGGTLAAAALFNPVRRRVGRAVDRRFNRARYDARLVVDGFGSTMREAADIDSVAGDLSSSVHDILQPSSLAVWLKEPA